MGYAQVAGVPAVYGLYGAIILPLVYAIFTKTNHIVFGMDSAAVAITGSMLAWMGIEAFSQDALVTMPVLTLMTGLLLVVFHFMRMGKLADYVPEPVMKGFILGVVVMVVAGQLPALLGADIHASGVAGIFSALAEGTTANTLTILLSAISLSFLLIIAKLKPKWPGAIILLLVMTVLSALLGLNSRGVAVLGEVPTGIPWPAIPPIILDIPQLLQMGVAAFAIAATVAIESALALKAFDEAQHANSELRAFGFANITGAFFCCPAGSASMSRTAAAIAGNGKTQLTSVVSAIGVLLFLVVLSPFIESLPLCVLSSIVVIAMLSLADWKTAARYAKNMKSEFAIMSAVAAITVFFGAIVGFAFGFAASAVMHLLRKAEVTGTPKELGFGQATADDGEQEHDSLSFERVNHSLIVALSGFPSFTNVNPWIRKMEARLEAERNIKRVIFDISDVRDLDITAADTLRDYMGELKARGLGVRIVREIGITGDSYTRYAIRRLMKRGTKYPTVDDALADKNKQKMKDIQVQVIEEEKEA